MIRKLGGMLIVGCVLATAGCGGATPLSHAQFTRRADAICNQMLSGFVAAAHRAKVDKMSHEKAALYGLTHLPPHIDRELVSLDQLAPPEEMQSSFDAYRSALKAYSSLVPKVVAARGTRTMQQIDVEKHRQGTRLYSIYHQQGAISIKTRALAHKMGLKVCT